MIITISGFPGSGKSTIAKLVAEKLGFEHYSVGDFQRQLAKEHGMSITEWGQAEAKDKKYDLMVDKRTEEAAQSKDNVVFDGWLAPHFTANAKKIWLECDEEVRVKRRLSQKRETEEFEEIQTAINDMRERVKCNQNRWIEYYNYDFLNMKNYDLVVDVSNIAPEEIVGQIMNFLNQ